MGSCLRKRNRNMIPIPTTPSRSVSPILPTTPNPNRIRDMRDEITEWQDDDSWKTCTFDNDWTDLPIPQYGETYFEYVRNRDIGR